MWYHHCTCSISCLSEKKFKEDETHKMTTNCCSSKRPITSTFATHTCICCKTPIKQYDILAMFHFLNHVILGINPLSWISYLLAHNVISYSFIINTHTCLMNVVVKLGGIYRTRHCFLFVFVWDWMYSEALFWNFPDCVFDIPSGKLQLRFQATKAISVFYFGLWSIQASI